MKKNKTPKAVISKQAFQIAKGGAAGSAESLRTRSVDSTSGRGGDVGTPKRNEEEEIMGETGRVKRSDAMEKNLNQMVSVLHSRLKSLEYAAITRLKLCEEDLMPNSTRMSKHASKIFDEFDDAVPKSLKDSKLNANVLYKDNLVSSDTICIDPYHLVLKTKQPTDAAKKLEINLEESFGNMNLKEMKSKKSKTQSEKSKKSEQLKNEAKRMNRLKLEKELQGNMENFVARSVMDQELIFQAPERVNEEAKWPIPMKWSTRDPRSENPENSDGEFDPDLLLQYALERISLPSGKKVFSWLIRQPMVQRHFVTLFWLVKVKFFDHFSEAEIETYLLRLMSIEYRRIMELLAIRAHAEHEKDFVYKYYPFLLTSGIYFAFFYLCPGSRHIYTKGFKKTIYMQIIQIMYGIQLCASSVKVSWAKMFPEDNHEEGDEGEEGGELFPVQLALNTSKAMKPATLPTQSQANKDKNSPILSAIQNVRAMEMFDDSNAGGGLPSIDKKPRSTSFNLHANTVHSDSRPGHLASEEGYKPGNGLSVSFSGDFGEIQRQHILNPTISEEEEDDWTKSSGDDNSIAKPLPLIHRSKTQRSFFKGASKMGYLKEQNKITVDDFAHEAKALNPLVRTQLQKPMEKPNPKFTVKHQNNVEVISAQSISPQIQLYFASMDAKTSFPMVASNLHRTIPVSWCAAGGADTHKKVYIATDLQKEMRVKLQESRNEFKSQSSLFHTRKMSTLQNLERSLNKVLGSGTTNIGKYSLDIRKQRSNRNNNVSKETTSQLEDLTLAETAALAQYDDAEVDKFIAEI